MYHKAKYERKLNKSTFTLTIEKDFEAESDSIEMFHYNNIPYFLKLDTRQENMKLKCCYDITGKHSLEQLFEYKSLNYLLLQKILHSFDQACLQAENYMLTENSILLNPEFIFTESDCEHISFCYLPGNQRNIRCQFNELMDYLLLKVDHADEKAVQLAYGIHQRVAVNLEALNAVLKDLEKIIDSPNNKHNFQIPLQYNKKLNNPDLLQYTRQSAQTIPSQFCEQSTQSETIQYNNPKQHQNYLNKNNFVQKEKNALSELPKDSSIQTQEQNQLNTKFHKKVSMKRHAAEKIKNFLHKKIYTNNSNYTEVEPVFEADLEEETSISSPTICLVQNTEETHNQFIYQGSDRSRDFCCSKDKMIVGSNINESDIYIPLPMISRVHALIEVNEQGTFLEDMNSTNGTHINGELLQYRERRMLQKGDIISLAGECYSFH